MTDAERKTMLREAVDHELGEASIRLGRVRGFWPGGSAVVDEYEGYVARWNELLAWVEAMP